MNLRDEFNRIGNLFHNGMEKTQKVSGDWAQERAREAGAAARKVRERVDLRPIVSAEERVVRHVRENPALYLIGAALLIGVLIAKLLAESRDRREAPLL